MKIRTRASGLLWVLGAAVVITVVVVSPSIVQLAAVGLSILAVVAFMLSFNQLLLLWGILLPIWSVWSIDPLAFDLARVVVAGMILIKAGKLNGPSLFTRRVGELAVPLSAVSGVLIILGTLRPDPATLTWGETMLLGLVVATVVVSRAQDPWPLLNGYLIGTLLSSAVLLASAVGHTALTPQVNGGFFRLTGLAPSATLITYQLAIGVVIAWAGFGRKVHRPWYVVSLPICLAALALSGGRGGVLALGFAVIVAVRWRWFRPIPLIMLALVGWGGLIIAAKAGITVNTLHRLIDSSPSGVTDGRGLLLTDGIRLVIHNPITGSGLAMFRGQTGMLPHETILTFFIAGGIIGGLIIMWATLSLVGRVLFVSPGQAGPAGKAAHLILSVVIVMTFLEPSGPFVGTELITLMLISVGITSQRTGEVDGPLEKEKTVERATK